MRTVILSKRASKKLAKLFDYLEAEWSIKTRNDFLRKFQKSITQIQKYPKSCPETNSVKDLRMLVITKQTSLFYKFDTKSIKIITIFDNRMNPKNIKKEVE